MKEKAVAVTKGSLERTRRVSAPAYVMGSRGLYEYTLIRPPLDEDSAAAESAV